MILTICRISSNTYSQSVIVRPKTSTTVFVELISDVRADYKGPLWSKQANLRYFMRVHSSLLPTLFCLSLCPPVYLSVCHPVCRSVSSLSHTHENFRQLYIHKNAKFRFRTTSGKIGCFRLIFLDYNSDGIVFGSQSNYIH